MPEIRRYLVEILPQLHLLPDSIDIEADDLLEAKKVNRELLLRRQLKPVLSDFDVVVIDTLPAMRAATVNALVVADSVIIPIDSSSFALLGMNQLLKTIAAISRDPQSLPEDQRSDHDVQQTAKPGQDHPTAGGRIFRPKPCPGIGHSSLCRRCRSHRHEEGRRGEFGYEFRHALPTFLTNTHFTRC